MVVILIVEKDMGQLDRFRACLERGGYTVVSVPDHAVVTQLRTMPWIMVVCPLSLRDDKGIRAVLRGRFVLWAVSPEDLPRNLHNFTLGREDYIVVPTEDGDLMARVSMLLRNVGVSEEPRLQIGSLVLDGQACLVERNGEEIPLTQREFALIFGLLSAPGKVFSRKKLLQTYWEEGTKTSTRAVDVYITKLRAKFAHCPEFEIVTVYGAGYKVVLRNPPQKRERK